MSSQGNYPTLANYGLEWGTRAKQRIFASLLIASGVAGLVLG
jgi:hypothetical protein